MNDINKLMDELNLSINNQPKHIERNNNILKIEFSYDNSLILIFLNYGYEIYNCSNYKLISNHNFESSDIYNGYLYYNSNLLFILTENDYNNVDKYMFKLFNDENKCVINSLSFKDKIRGLTYTNK